MKKLSKWLCLLLCLLMVLPALAGRARAAQEPEISRNQYDSLYTRYAETVKSTLTADGADYLRIEYIDDRLVIERYDASLNFVSSSQITLPLPIYGGVYICEDANFVVCGQTNREESKDQEVIRIIKYTKDWQEVSYASLKGANTTVPFDAGSLRFARSGNMLFIRTSHEMYRSSDGYNHQANLTLRVDVSSMSILNSQYTVSNSGYGYCSHSFNQFIQVDGDTVLAVDHGDAYPRSIALFKYSASAQGSRFPFNAKCISVLPIVGSTGDNSTGAFVGGFEYSSSHYLVAGNTVDQVEGTSFYGQRNIFVTATPKDNFTQAGTVIRYITDYSDDSGIKCTAPHLVKISADKFFLIWGAGDTLSYCFLNGKGEPISEIYSGEGTLSDCVPIVSGNTILWYVTDDSYPVFYRIDLNTPETVSMTHRHTYTLSITKSPTDTAEGAATAQCKICNTSEDVVMPPLSSDAYTIEVIKEPTCGSYGQNKITWKHETLGSFYLSQRVSRLECSYGDWIVEKEATCTETGRRYKVCSQCGSKLSQTTSKLSHDYSYTVTTAPTLTSSGVLNGTCSGCFGTASITLPVLSTSNYYRSIVQAPDCMAEGTDRYTWWNTYYGSFAFDVTTDALGHDYLSAVTAPSCTDEGYTTYSCIRCDDSYTDNYVTAQGHKEVTDAAVAATCTEDGKTEGKHCSVCGTVTKAQEAVKATGHSFQNGKCGICGEKDPDYVEPTKPTEPEVTEPKPTEPEVEGVTRVAGGDRYQTSFKSADTLKAALGVEKFQNIVVASGTDFPDALAGSYLAAVKNAPILLVRAKNVTQVKDYIKANLADRGTVYLLGGVNAVPKTMETGLDGFTVKRLGGANRYETNLLILKEAGVAGKDIIVCTGLNFADSLSASATGLPILLVKDGLYASQKAFLKNNGGDFIIVGGTGAVNATVEKQLKTYGSVKRLAGNTRYDTSVLVAKEFFDTPSAAVLAYAQNFPDGLCGGPLAYALNAPLILTDNNKPKAAVTYATGLGIKSGYVLGGTGLISNSVVKKVFSMASSDIITVK